MGDFCKRTKRINETVNTKELVHIIVNEKFKTLYCYIPKVGCTQWKKVMVQLNPSESDVWVHDPSNFTFLADYPQNESEQMLKSYFKFLFRTDIALTRYMSGAETSYKSIITFEEFVNFVVRLHETDEFRNEHWQTSDKLCHSLTRMTNFVSLPKLKGFKIAFLNIVSLPKYLDGLRLRMQSQTLDLLALSETRLDNTFTDSAVSVDGYTLMRRDRCRV